MYDLPPCWLEKTFFEGAALCLPWAESLHLEGTGHLEKMVMLVQDVGGLMRILEMVVAYTEGSSSQEAEMKNLQAKVAASEKAWVEEEKSRKLFDEETGRLSEECRVLLLKNKYLEEKVVALTIEVTPLKTSRRTPKI